MSKKSKAARGDLSSGSFYERTAVPSLVMPTTTAPGSPIVLITGRNSRGRGSGFYSGIGLPTGSNTPASEAQYMEILALTNRLRVLIREPKNRDFRFITEAFVWSDTLGKLQLLEFYHRYITFGGAPEHAQVTAEYMDRLGTFTVKRLTRENLYAVSVVSAALGRQRNEDSGDYRKIIEQAITRPDRGDEIVALITDRGMSRADEIIEMLDTMGEHHSSLSDGVL